MVRNSGWVSAWLAVTLTSCLALAQQPSLDRKTLRVQLPSLQDKALRITIPHRGSNGQVAQTPPAKAIDRARQLATPRAKATPADRSDPLAAIGAAGPFAYSAGGSHLVAAVRDGGGLAVWQSATRRRLHRLENSDRPYALVAISDDANWIAGVRERNSDQIDLWRADNGQHLRVIRAAGGPKSQLEFAGDNELRVQLAGGDQLVFSVPDGAATGGSIRHRVGSAMKTPHFEIDSPRDTMPQAPSTSRAAPSIASPREQSFGQSPPRAMDSIESPTRKSSPSTPSPRSRATRSIAPPPSMPASAAPAPGAVAPDGEPEPSRGASDAAERFRELVGGAAPGEPASATPDEPPAPDEPTTVAPGAGADEPIVPPLDDPAGGSAPDVLESLLSAPGAAAPSASAPPPSDPGGGASSDAQESVRGLPGAADSAEAATDEMESAAPPEPESDEPATAAPAAPPLPPRSFRFEMSEPTADEAETSEAPPEPADATMPPAMAPPPVAALPPAAASSPTERQLEPDAQPAPPPPTSVNIHFATNRNRLAPKDRQWPLYFKGFFGSLPAFVIYGLVILAILIFPWFGKRSWAAVAIVAGGLTLCGMGAVEAYVRSQLRNELSGELYGCRPTDLSYGSCEISVPPPRNRRAGDLSRPLTVWVFEAPENPDKHFVLRRVAELKDKEAFYQSLATQMGKFDAHAALLFIHGYNVSFEDAIFRTAQLAVDLKFPGAPIAFCWPSYADPVKYPFDEQNAEVSIPALREMLDDLASRSGAKRIHIIAHSMGNRVLAGALRNMDAVSQVRNKQAFSELILAAPDIDSRVFRSQVLPSIVSNTQHCTLYASSRDRALLMSRVFHNYQRLGETQPELLVANGVDTIDASLVDTSLLGHSYIGDVQSIVSDLHDLVVAGKRATERIGLETLKRDALKYWLIKPDLETAADQSLLR